MDNNAPRPTKTDELVLYRLHEVETAVKEVGLKVDRNIQKADLTEFKEAIISRITDMKNDLQKQIDTKADKSELKDVKKLLGAASAALTSIIVALIIAYLTSGGAK